MSRNLRVAAFTGILLLAVFFRFYHFRTLPPGLYPDEAMNGNNAVEVVETGHFQPFYTENNGREGLYINALAVLYKLHPVDEPWLLRLPAEAAGVLTVAGTCLLFTELFSASTGLLTAFLLATALWPVMISRLGFRANFCVLLFVWAVYVLLKALRTGANARGLALAALAAGLYGLAWYTYLPIRITPLLLLVLVPFFRRRPHFWPRAALFTVVWLAVLTPLVLYFAAHPQDFLARSAQLAVTHSRTPVRFFLLGLVQEVVMLNFHGDRNWRHNFSKAPELFLPLGVLFWAGVYVAGRRIAALRGATAQQTAPAADASAALEDPRLPYVFLFAWYLLSLIPPASALEVPSALRSVLLQPAVMAFVALGTLALWRLLAGVHRPRLASALVALLCVAVCLHTGVRYFHDYPREPRVPGYFAAQDLAASAAINALPAATPKYAVLPESGGFWTRGLPTSAATTQFLTHSFTEADRAARHIQYLPHGDTRSIPAGTPPSQIFFIGAPPPPER